MKAFALTFAALIFLPAAVPAASVSVDVRVAGGLGWSSENWIEFCPDRGAYVALYATFSDGSVQRVFPSNDGASHWVDGWETYAVPVAVPRGVCITNVQAVASLDWFDPSDWWVASGPPARRTYCVVRAGSWVRPRPAWGFVVGWSSPEPVRCVDAPKPSTVKTKARVVTHAKSRTGEIAYASSGTSTSMRTRGSGEPVKRSRR